MHDGTVATTVRYRVLFVCSIMSVLLYLDRYCVSSAEVFITEDLALSGFGTSLLLGSFFLSYAIGQVSSGWLADRFGGRTMMTIYIVAWTMFTGLTGLANGIVVLVALRLGLGLAQAGAYPTSATLIAKWVPLTRRGLASSCVALGGRIGGILAMLVTGYVILFFVPVEIPSTLVESDILSAERLSYELVHGKVSPQTGKGEPGLQGKVGQRLLERFPSDLRQSITRVAQRFQDTARAPHDANRPPSTSTNDPNDLEQDVSYRRQLAAAISGVVQGPMFIQPQELSDVKLEIEAKRLLKLESTPAQMSPAQRSQSQLSQSQLSQSQLSQSQLSQSQLSQSQRERLNRLVLEGVYPASIKKVYCAGWRNTMFLFGALGFPVALLFWLVCRDDPHKHPRVNAAELALIEHGRTSSASSTGRVGSLPLVELITSGSMWCNGAMQFFTNMGWILLVTYTPRYFTEVHHMPVEQRAWMTTCPAIAGVVGMFIGGIITDPMATRWGKRWGRSIPIFFTRIAAGCTYLFCLLDPSPWTATILLSLTSFWCDLGIPAVWAFQQDTGGKYTGSVLGWGNMWGNIGAFLGPPLINFVIGGNQNWNAVFITSSVAFIFSGMISLGIDASRTIAEEKN